MLLRVAETLGWLVAESENVLVTKGEKVIDSVSVTLCERLSDSPLIVRCCVGDSVLDTLNDTDCVRVSESVVNPVPVRVTVWFLTVNVIEGCAVTVTVVVPWDTPALTDVDALCSLESEPTVADFVNVWEDDVVCVSWSDLVPLDETVSVLVRVRVKDLENSETDCSSVSVSVTVLERVQEGDLDWESCMEALGPEGDMEVRDQVVDFAPLSEAVWVRVCVWRPDWLRLEVNRCDSESLLETVLIAWVTDAERDFEAEGEGFVVLRDTFVSVRDGDSVNVFIAETLSVPEARHAEIVCDGVTRSVSVCERSTVFVRVVVRCDDSETVRDGGDGVTVNDSEKDSNVWARVRVLLLPNLDEKDMDAECMRSVNVVVTFAVVVPDTEPVVVILSLCVTLNVRVFSSVKVVVGDGESVCSGLFESVTCGDGERVEVTLSD